MLKFSLVTRCGMAVHAEGRAGRALGSCQLDQGAMGSTRKKAMASGSAPITTDSAALLSLHPAEHRDLRGRRQWGQVPAW